MKKIVLTGFAIAVLFGTALEIRFASEVKDRINAVPCPCTKKRSAEDCKCSSYCPCGPKVSIADAK